jgi:hypothetical protein
MERDIKKIISNFSIKGRLIGFEPVVTGHINDSYFIKTDSADHPGYFLQWINNYIFKDVKGLMNNIAEVVQHLSGKLARHPELAFKVLEIIPSKNSTNYYLDEDGQYWRLYTFIEKAHSYDVVENTQIAFEGGKAFGIFMSLLADLPADRLAETIPDFHNMEKRLGAFYNSLNNNTVNRVKDIPAEIEFVKQRAAEMLRIPALIQSGGLPLRITHNDTKFNNILFDVNDHAICIVDLDTVMPGSILFDFGDAIRTGANTATEDEKDLSKVDINLPIYEAYTRGFIKSTKHTLTEPEISNLAFAARYMTFIIGLRFLTDFIDGDPYFRTAYPLHNLDRTKVQFRLVEAMEKNFEQMQAIVMQSIEEA